MQANNPGDMAEGVALGAIISENERCKSTGEKKIFVLSEIRNAYDGHLGMLRVDLETPTNSTLINNRLLSHLPDMIARKKRSRCPIGLRRLHGKIDARGHHHASNVETLKFVRAS